MEDNVMDCSKHCNSIIIEMKPISDEIKKLEAEHVNKVYSEEDLEKRNELDKQLEQYSIDIMNVG